MKYEETLLDELTADESEAVRGSLKRLRDTGYGEVTVHKGASGVAVIPVVKAGPDYSDAVMLCVRPRMEEADALVASAGVEFAATDLHVTLAYLGRADELGLGTLAEAAVIASEVAQWWQPLYGQTAGVGAFHAGDDGIPVWSAVDVPGLSDLRSALVAALEARGVPVSRAHDFTPHMTLAYVDALDDVPDVPALPLTFDNLCLVVGEGESAFAFGDAISDVDEVGLFGEFMAKVKKTLGRGVNPATSNPTLRKSSDELRFTLGPWYVPSTLDAHDEWTDGDELQKALWDYVDSGDRGIRLQHNREVVAGRWVEAMQWPHSVAMPMDQGDGVTKQVTFPAGTVFLGVRWEEWAWPLVKNGEIRGYSIGGTSRRVTVDLPEPEQS
jgi:2'-5' RNA ligase